MAEMLDIKIPEFGDKLQNGAMVLSYTHFSNGGEGYLPNGIVLAKTSGGRSKTEFVTWNCYLSENDDLWHCEAGHYYISIVEAANDYENRGGK